jgi:hypothetical protein
MRNCSKTSEINHTVSLLATSGSYMMSARFSTVDLEPFEFAKVSTWVTACTWLDYRECHSLSCLEREETAQLTVLQATTGLYFLELQQPDNLWLIHVKRKNKEFKNIHKYKWACHNPLEKMYDTNEMVLPLCKPTNTKVYAVEQF